jgi:hypothetical protein
MGLVWDTIVAAIRLNIFVVKALLNLFYFLRHHHKKMSNRQPKYQLLSPETRFEHMHIVAGSGHGKTQLIQQLVLDDLHALLEGRGSIVIMDSQGDLINNILHLKMLEKLSDRLVIVDPHDIDNPPALNLFDIGKGYLGDQSISRVDREMLYNSAVDLYDYVFGALLGAELTSRQGMIFKFLARLMLVIPNATIYTLMDLVRHPEMSKPYHSRLDPLTKMFFEQEFSSKIYDDTRAQIQTRLYTVLASSSTLAGMFTHERNMVKIGKAMNTGSLIVINTAKDLLKQEGCEILGRFFIALIMQATVERAVIPTDRRRSTFVFIDEAQDYFDARLRGLLEQARKFKVGMILAHQNLDQLTPGLKATLMANTTTKIAGGLSTKDVREMAAEIGCEPEIFAEARKDAKESRFIWTIRNQREPSVLHVPLGLMERQPRLEPGAYARILDENRKRISAPPASPHKIPEYQTAGASALGQPEVL